MMSDYILGFIITKWKYLEEGKDGAVMYSSILSYCLLILHRYRRHDSNNVF